MAYAVSFLTIGIIWVNHHGLMAQIDRADRIFLFLNVVPAHGRRVHPVPDAARSPNTSRDDGATAAAVSYGITLTATAVMFNRSGCTRPAVAAGCSGPTTTRRP